MAKADFKEKKKKQKHPTSAAGENLFKLLKAEGRFSTKQPGFSEQ